MLLFHTIYINDKTGLTAKQKRALLKSESKSKIAVQCQQVPVLLLA